MELKDNALPALSHSVSFLSPSLGWYSQHSRGLQRYKKRLGGKAIKDYFKAQKNPYNTYDVPLPSYKKGFGSLFLHFKRLIRSCLLRGVLMGRGTQCHVEQVVNYCGGREKRAPPGPLPLPPPPSRAEPGLRCQEPEPGSGGALGLALDSSWVEDLLADQMPRMVGK